LGSIDVRVDRGPSGEASTDSTAATAEAFEVASEPTLISPPVYVSDRFRFSRAGVHVILLSGLAGFNKVGVLEEV
jgi:hypothetical protein